MKTTPIKWALLCCLAVAMGACKSGSSSNSGDTSTKPLLAAFNAAPDMPDVTFLRVEEVWSSIAYGIATGYRSVDADTYNLNFDALLPGDQTGACAGDVNKNGVKDTNECTRLVTKSVNALQDHEYLVALMGLYGALTAQVYDDALHVFSTTSNNGTGDTNMQVQFFNWSSNLGTFDVYLEPPGTNLSVTQVKATLAPGEEYNGLVEQGTYVLTLTPVGQPDNPFYLSQNFDVAKQTRVAFGILDGTNESTSNVKVARFRDQGGDLPDRRLQTLLRTSHVAPKTGNVDIYAQEDYTAPLFANLGLNQTSPYTVIDPSLLNPLELDVTPAGNVGVLLDRELEYLTSGSRTTVFLVDTANGQLKGLLAYDGARRIAPYAELQLVNSLTQNLDYYVIPHNNHVYTSSVTQALGSSSIGGYQQFAPGAYDVYMMRTGTTSIVFGPQEVQMNGGGLYTIVGVPTADITHAAILQLGDFLN
jgi:hypothetical protein